MKGKDSNEEGAGDGRPLKKPRIQADAKVKVKRNAKANTNTASVAYKGTKRPRLPGTIRKLTAHPVTNKVPRPVGMSAKANITTAGNKINKGLGTGGFLASAKGSNVEEELFVTRKSPFSFMLKKGISAFVERAAKHLTVKAMGAAIPAALSLALAIQDNLPCPKASVQMQVTTDSVDCLDEVIPPEELAEVS